MQLDRILAAAARNGITIEQDKTRQDHFYLIKGEHKLDFYVDQTNNVGHATYRSPHTDAMTDCFCDSYFDTIKSIMHYLNPTGVFVKPARAVDGAATASVDNVEVSKNEEKQGIEIRFPGKPDQDVINTLKGHGFRWSPFNSVWWKKYSPDMMVWAETTFMPKNTNEAVAAVVIEEETVLASAT